MFEEVKKKLGFGCMRLPMRGDEVDYEQFNKMTDDFINAGFNYFDTAHGYIQGKSETAIRDCLVKRYPRESYILTNKLTGDYFQTEEEVRPFFEKQLEICGVDYFDFYLMHTQTKNLFAKFKRCRAYEQALEFKKEGKIKHLGISFHDTAEVLEQILTEYPQIETVQIQLNYVDYEDPAVQSRKCLEVCNKFNKPIIVMEPVKGGALATMTPEVQKLFKDANPEASVASWAVRYAASLDGLVTVLSGMSDLGQMEDNLSYMADFQPLSTQERAVVDQVVEVLKNTPTIPCTACKYCVRRRSKRCGSPSRSASSRGRRSNISISWQTSYAACPRTSP